MTYSYIKIMLGADQYNHSLLVLHDQLQWSNWLHFIQGIVDRRVVLLSILTKGALALYL